MIKQYGRLPGRPFLTRSALGETFLKKFLFSISLLKFEACGTRKIVFRFLLAFLLRKSNHSDTEPPSVTTHSLGSARAAGRARLDPRTHRARD
jgi:hypothetical protein